MAGRNLSTRHDALGAVRVMRTGGCMGEIVGMAAKGNRDPYWNATFSPVKTTKMRLWITRTDGGISRIWEVDPYGAVTTP